MMARGTWALSAVVMGGWILLASGCGGGGGQPQYGSTERNEDQKTIARLVDGLTDNASRPDEMRRTFTPDSLPKTQADAAKYGNYQFRIQDPIEITGDTATFTVTIYDQQGTPHTQTWSAKRAKVDNEDTWQLSSAPLP